MSITRPVSVPPRQVGSPVYNLAVGLCLCDICPVFLSVSITRPASVPPRQVGSPVYNLAVGLCLSSTGRLDGAPVTMTECRDEPGLIWDVLADG